MSRLIHERVVGRGTGAQSVQGSGQVLSPYISHA
jgi:hypothetical protein